MNRRAFLTGIAGVGGLAALGACSGGTSSGSSPATSGGGKGAASIVHWDQMVAQESWIKKEIELFQAAHPSAMIKRQIQQSGDLEKVIDLAFRGGNAPDVFMVPNGKLDDYIEAGQVLSLEKYATLDWQKTFPPYSFVDGVNAADGKIYSAPYTGNSPWLQLYINNKVFKDAGLVEADGTVKIPKTWAEVTLFAEQITKKSNGSVHGIGFGNSAFAMIPWWAELFTACAGIPTSTAGGFPGGMDPRTGKFTFRSERILTDFLQLFQEWKNKGFIFPQALSIDDEIARQHFARGKFGMTVGGVWNQVGWSELGFTDYSLTSLITPDGQQKSSFYHGATSYSLAISATTKNPDEAFEWFRWWTGKDAGARYVQELKGGISVHPEANDASKVDFPPFAAFVETTKLIIPGPHPALRNPAMVNVAPKAVLPDFNAITTGYYNGQIKDLNSALAELGEKEEKSFVDALEKAQKKGHKVSKDDYVFADWDLMQPYKWDIPEYIQPK
ncbi:ABC transporter substrate-binding protein [Nonomuraea sp. NPDC050556]|uniref:ABC transporter substrate-binding protein n=1 Tax=Nonomuraea sp. NPDC050556 TaxID=3364369 RepID=UPI0037B389D9